VRALIVDDTDLALGITHQHDRLAADEGAKIVATVFHLAFVTDINPGSAEYPLQLEFKDRRIGIKTAMNPSRLYQGGEGFRHGLHRQLPKYLAIARCL